MIYGCDNEDIVLLVDAADFSVINPTKSTLLHALSFLCAAKLCITNLCKTHRLYAAKKNSSFSTLIEVMVSAPQSPSRSVKMPFL